MPRKQHQSNKHHYKTQMKGTYDPVKHRRRHHYSHELTAVVEEPEVKQPETENPHKQEAPKADTYQ
tara:strand:- start:272 stop:469 length:198 start_codon:yes stop_codon:yes gene_type:complete